MVPYVGCAGWSLSSRSSLFGSDGTHLERYSQHFPAVEINSSFYKPHQTKTYARWADCTPAKFRFSIKLPKLITHDMRLQNAQSELQLFQSQVIGLGEKLGPLLVQLPPSLKFELPVANRFMIQLRDLFDSSIVWEPRHPTWFCSESENLLADFNMARVAADPAPVLAAASPAGWKELVYFRLHGSPRMYYSAYDEHYLTDLAERLGQLCEQSIECWCIFDNTAAGAALENAMEVQRRLQPETTAAENLQAKLPPISSADL